MKFVHIADVHFDASFSSLSSTDNLISKRKLEQMEAFRKVVEYVKEQSVDYFFIAGDLYENENIKVSTIEFINNLFKEIPNTKIFITPGNHDPFLKESIYNTFEFAENVKIFKSESIEKYEDENVQIYGFGFNDFYLNKSPLDDFKLGKSDKPQILIAHCDLNGISDANGYSYNPISSYKLNSLNFDYVAMGHIHKTNFDADNNIIYPGSLISLGFDETGNHGMIIGEFKEKYLKLDFVKIDEREFINKEVDISDMNSQNDLIDYLSTLYFEKLSLVKIILKGNRKIVINTREILDLLDNPNIVKIKDETKLGYNLEEICKENSLKGIFVKKLLELKNKDFYSIDEIEKAIEIGLQSME